MEPSLDLCGLQVGRKSEGASMRSQFWVLYPKSFSSISKKK